ncbi:hypothetical protein FRC04_011784 [Tulasnella sp. 424]|nr:hypothetical protein FRC04_011784 [Tulasnella sp. 424]KAG8978127.1 hypothetical protein FRC05_011243 [Tulasnella sp. 425]
MIPTPDLSHLTKDDYQHVYEPAEDTFILLDALEQDADYLKSLNPRFCLEIGSGSGCVLSFLGAVLGSTSALYVGTDINIRAAQATMRTGLQNKVSTSALVTSLYEGLERRIEHQVDLLVFNPPYVPTFEDEATMAQDGRDIAGAWAGGADGMAITDQLLKNVDRMLSPSGVFYLVAVKQNDPEGICARMRGTYGLEGEIVLKRRAGGELLHVLRAWAAFVRRPAMISAFFIFNQKGEVLISRLFRPDLKRSIADVFRIQVVSNSDVRSPIITLGSTSFFHVRVNNVYVMAVTKNNANAALVFEFIYKFNSIARSYFSKVDEESVKNNFVLIYELIDEILDFGFPQNSEIDTLKMYITTESVKSEAAVREESTKITSQATGSTAWRRNDIRYKKNEAFVDVVESVNLLMSAKGSVLRADVDGHIMMRAYLSGTPECKFGLNDKLLLGKSDRDATGDDDAVELDDCQFHQCVRLGKFDADRSITFIPPDGEFELMKYRCTRDVNLPLKVIPTVVEHGRTKVEYNVTIRTNFSSKLYATEITLRIPTPLNATKVDPKFQHGKAKYTPSENVLLWKIPRMQGGTEATLTAIADLTSTTNQKPWARPPIDVDFQVLMLTASGLSVRYLKVFEKTNYHSVKWVRYLTKASGTYQIRI